MEEENLLTNVKRKDVERPTVLIGVLIWFVLLCSSATAVYNKSTVPHVAASGFMKRPLKVAILVNRDGDYELRYAVEGSRPVPVSLSNGDTHGCTVVGTRFNQTYCNVVLRGLGHNTTYYYGFGATAASFPYKFKTLKRTNNRILIVGDTRPPMGYKTMVSQNVDLIVHLGDMSYIGNDGSCYGDGSVNPRCAYNCTGGACMQETRNTAERSVLWDQFFERTWGTLSSVPLMTQAGNHDGDIFWQMMFIPTFSTRHYGSFFMSVDVGSDLRILSMNTEDNANNPYDRWYAAGDPFDWYRFNQSFGSNSSQYAWMLRELDRPSDNRTVILYTHRPPIHLSRHHPSCGVGGDWYRCELRKLYAPLFNRVDYVFSGHSHHYMRLDNITVSGDTGGIRQSGSTSYFVVGTGGYPLSHGFTAAPLGLRSTAIDDKHYGYVTGPKFQFHQNPNT